MNLRQRTRACTRAGGRPGRWRRAPLALPWGSLHAAGSGRAPNNSMRLMQPRRRWRCYERRWAGQTTAAHDARNHSLGGSTRAQLRSPLPERRRLCGATGRNDSKTLVVIVTYAGQSRHSETTDRNIGASSAHEKILNFQVTAGRRFHISPQQRPRWFASRWPMRAG